MRSANARGVIRGKVTSWDSSAPLAGIAVSLRTIQGTNGYAPEDVPGLGTFTGADGTYQIEATHVEKAVKDAGLPVLFHSCGNVTDVIGDMIDIGLDVLEPVQQVMDFKYLKREFGKRLTFWGGVGTQTVLPFGTPDEVRRETGEVIETLGRIYQQPFVSTLIDKSEDILEKLFLPFCSEFIITAMFNHEVINPKFFAQLG